jgi:TolA-binding protein
VRPDDPGASPRRAGAGISFDRRSYGGIGLSVSGRLSYSHRPGRYRAGAQGEPQPAPIRRRPGSGPQPERPQVSNRFPKIPSSTAGARLHGLAWGRGTVRGFWGTLLAVFLLTGGCAYFNTFYHAKQFYKSAEKARETEQKRASGLTGGQTAGSTYNTGINPADPRYANRQNQATGRSSDLYTKCIEKCKKVIDEYPGSKLQDDARLLMAKAYYGKGDYLSARSELDHFAERFPKSNKLAEAAYWRGLTAFAQEDYPGARAIWTDLLQRYPKYDDRESAQFYIAEALRAEDLSQQAETAYQEFLKSHTKGELAVQARLALGQLLLEDKQYDRADRLFTHVANKAPEEEARLEAKLHLGEVLEAQDQNEDALKVYQDVELWLDPNVFKGRISAEERAAIREAQKKAEEEARQDSVRNAQFNLAGGTTKTGGINPATGQYDPNYNPNTQTGGINPATGQYDPNYNPNTQTGGINPATGQYDPNYNPNTQTGGINPATGQYDPNYNPNTQTGGINPVTGQYDPNYNPNTQTGGINPATGQYDPNYNPNAQINQQTGQPVGSAVAAQMNKQQRQTLPKTDPRYEQLGRVLLKEGQALAAVGKPWDAIQAYEQVIDEYRGTPYAAEAQYRIGYTYEVDLEDFDEAQKAYQAVSRHGRSSFTEDAERRAKNLGTVKNLLAEAASDSASAATAAAAQAHFMRAELYLFQQDKPEKALAEYQEIQKDFPGTEHEAKAALAEAWVRMNALADTARGRAKYAEVMRRFPDTEYGRRATRILKGPEREPSPEEFDGPTLAELRDPLNIASVTARDSLLAATEAPPPVDSTATPAGSPADTSAGASVGERQRALLERMRHAAPGDTNQTGPSPPGGRGLNRAVAIARESGSPAEARGSPPAEPPVLPPGGQTPPNGPAPSNPPARQVPGGSGHPPVGPAPGESPPGPSPARAAEKTMKSAPGGAPPGHAGTPPETAGPIPDAALPPGVGAVEDTVPPAPMPPPKDLGRKPLPVGPSGAPLDPLAVPVADGWSPVAGGDSTETAGSGLDGKAPAGATPDSLETGGTGAPAESLGTIPSEPDTARSGGGENAADSLKAVGQNGAAPADSSARAIEAAPRDSTAAKDEKKNPEGAEGGP